MRAADVAKLLAWGEVSVLRNDSTRFVIYDEDEYAEVDDDDDEETADDGCDILMGARHADPTDGDALPLGEGGTVRLRGTPCDRANRFEAIEATHAYEASDLWPGRVETTSDQDWYSI